MRSADLTVMCFDNEFSVGRTIGFSLSIYFSDDLACLGVDLSYLGKWVASKSYKLPSRNDVSVL